MNEIKKTIKKERLYIATPLLAMSRFSILPEDVRDVGREVINQAKAGKAVSLDKPNLKYFKEA